MVHERVAAGADDFRAGDGAITFDLDFHGADERFVLLEDGGGLLPLAEEAIVDEFVIPTKFTGSAACATFARAVGSRPAASVRRAGLGCALIGRFPRSG